MNIKILYEDEDVVVIDKPAGVVVNRAESVVGETVQDWAESKLEIRSTKSENSEIDELFRKRSGMVHRLDRDTSGVMVWAKKPEVMRALLEQFRQRQTEKTYLALVHGRLVGEGRVKVPMARSRRNRQRFEVALGGRMTETGYKVLETVDRSKDYEDGFTLVELYPKTGRTHQLRVVLAHFNHPIVGDGHYLGGKRGSADARWCPRQFLHAKRLCLTMPASGERRCFESALPSDLQTAWQAIKAAV